MAAARPGMAARDALGRHPRAAHGPVRAQRVERVLRAARVVAAAAGRRAAGQQRRDHVAPGRARPRAARARRPGRRRSRGLPALRASSSASSPVEPGEAAARRPSRRARPGDAHDVDAARRGVGRARRTPRAGAASAGSARRRRRPCARRRARGAPRRRRPPRAGTCRPRGGARPRTGHAGRRRRTRRLARAGAGLSSRPRTLRSGGEPLAAAGASALDDHAARAGRHPLAEAVRLGALAAVWLVGTLHEELARVAGAATV